MQYFPSDNENLPTYACRMYLSYGYPHNQLNGPYTLDPGLLQKDKNRIKLSYLNREFILSSTTITIQRFKYCHKDKLLTLSFNSDLIDTNAELDAPILQCAAINFDKLFQQARVEKAEINIPWYLSPTNSVLYRRIFAPLCALIALFQTFYTIINNSQTILFWSQNIYSGSTWFILVNVVYSFAFLIYFTIKQPYGCCFRIFFFCRVLLFFFFCLFIFGPFISIILLIYILMNEEVNTIIGNNNSHQMESDIAYFISQRDWIETDDKESHHNWNLLTNASCRILTVIMHGFIMEHITNNCTKDANYKRCQMTKFETEYQLNSECLFEYRKCDEMVKEKKK
eukprot:289391_1